MTTSRDGNVFPIVGKKRGCVRLNTCWKECHTIRVYVEWIKISTRRYDWKHIILKMFSLKRKKCLIVILGCVQGCIIRFVCLSQSMCNIRGSYRLRELYAADFHKPGIYGGGRVWPNAWDVFRRTSSQGGRGRQGSCGFRGVFLLR